MPASNVSSYAQDSVMPRTVRPKERIKRTKTFTGCWTCRSRGVKCDSTRPACLRCTRSKRNCEGYGIRLVWVDQHNTVNLTTPRPGRLQLSAEDRACPIFSEDYVDSALARLSLLEDSIGGETEDLIIGPYSVFKINVVKSPRVCTDKDANDDASVASQNACIDSAGFSDLDDDVENIPYLPAPVKISRRYDQPVTLTPQLLSSVQSFISTSSECQRFLLRTWVTSTSGLMTPIDYPDNPYRKIFIPLGLESANPNNLANIALIHVMYSMTAFNLAQLDPSSKYAADGDRYYQISLSYLRRSLRASDESQYEAILACLILMPCIDVINGKIADWRIHIRGGRKWLASVGKIWERSDTMSILYQMFECIEVLGLTHTPDNEACDSDPEWFSATTPLQAQENISLTFGNDEGSALLKHFGITKAILQAIRRISFFEHCDRVPLQEEIVALKTDILLANPITFRFAYEPKNAENMTRHHACAFYYACTIYFERVICRTPARDIQHLVLQTLHHLEAIESLETWDVSGILWPNFISACEADEEDSRRRSLRLLEKRHKQGIGSIGPMKDSILIFWGTRDLAGPGKDVDRRKVMRDLGIDILPI